MRSFSIRVGCSWKDDGAAWKQCLDAIGKVSEDATKRLKKHPKIRTIGALGTVVEGRKLRATPALTVLEGVCSAIDSADILLFDITPEVGQEQGKANVLFELGYAKGRGKEIYLLHRGEFLSSAVPSDLRGAYISTLSKGRFEQALHMRLVNRCVNHFLNPREVAATEHESFDD